MTKPSQWCDAEKALFVKRWSAGALARSIGVAHGLTAHDVYGLARRLGLPRRSGTILQFNNEGGAHRPWATQNSQLRELLDARRALPDIAQTLGRTQNAVETQLRKIGWLSSLAGYVRYADRFKSFSPEQALTAHNVIRLREWSESHGRYVATLAVSASQDEHVMRTQIIRAAAALGAGAAHVVESVLDGATLAEALADASIDADGWSALAPSLRALLKERVA